MARPRTDIEPRILHAARHRFLYEGVDGASLRTIAADAKTNVGMIYYYFRTKDELFLAVVEEVYGKLMTDLEEAVAIDAPPPERLRHAYLRMARMSDEEQMIVRLVLREALVSSERFQKLLARFLRGHVGLFLRLASEGVQAGLFNPQIPLPILAITSLAVGALPQVVMLAAKGRPELAMIPKDEDLSLMLSQIFMHGVSPPKA